MHPSTTSSCADRESAFAVAVTLSGGDRSVLLSLASALHRRGVDVVAARLTTPTGGLRRFEATIVASQRQAGTVEATLRNLVHVTAVRVARLGPAERVAEGVAV